MNELAPLLGKLAEQLGTTTQYLWGVLLKQAPVHASIMALEYGLTLIALVAAFRCRDAIGAWFNTGLDGDAAPIYFIGAVVVVIVTVIWVVACLFCVESFLTAIFNPEYWAFKEVLSAIKPK